MRRRFLVLLALIMLLLGTSVSPRAANALPATITGKADIVITNKHNAYYVGEVARCEATIHFPDGSVQVAYGECISGGYYAVPYDGTYDYVGTLQPDGTYDIVIDSSVSDGANEETFIPGELMGTQKMGKIRVRYEPEVTVTFSKSSANAGYTAGNREYVLAGATYDIFDARTNAKVATITTDEHGKAELALEPEASFYAIETKAPPGFKLDPRRIEFRTGMTPSTVKLSDEPGSFVLIIQKKDSATGGAAQPGVSLQGAEYRVTSHSTSGWSQTGVTDANGKLVIGNIPLGTIVVTETKAPAGYQLDPTPHEFHVAAGQLDQSGTFELKPADEFQEQVLAFDIDIIKYCDAQTDGSGLQDLAPGVRFQIISNTTKKIVGTIVTDERGFATTAGEWFGTGSRAEGINGALPYDSKGYTVREDPSTTPEGFQPCPDWTIAPEQLADGATLHYIVSNSSVRSRIQVVKTDAKSGQVVPLAGFAFQLLDKDRRPVSQEVWHPNHTELDTFTTDETGTVTLPESLMPGIYYIREVQAAAPYLLNGKDAKVVIENSPNTPPLTLVKVADSQARGIASIKKACSESGKALEGAEFDVVATEQVMSPDGTVQAAEGEVVDHVVTGADGVATTRELPLGGGEATYAFVETKAPAGHVLDATPRPATLSYKDGTTEVVTAQIEAENQASHLRVNKTITGTDEPLGGVEFAIWRKDAEISIKPDQAGTLAIRAGAGDALSARRVSALAVIQLDVPKDIAVTAAVAGGQPVEMDAEGSLLPAGTYEFHAQRDGHEVAGALGTFTLEADTAYKLSVKESIFGSRLALDAAGPAHDPVSMTYSNKDRAHVAQGLAAGTYVICRDAIELGTIHVGSLASYGRVQDGKLARQDILLKDDVEPLVITTDERGFADIRHLKAGSYRMLEVKAPDGIVMSRDLRSFTVDEKGLTEGEDSFAIAVENDYTKIEISKRSLANEDELAGAKLALTDEQGNLIERWTSGDEPHRIDALKPGNYVLVEEMTPQGFDKAQSVPFIVADSGEVQTVVMYDKPLTLDAQIDKRQEIADPTAPNTEANGDGLNRAEVTVSEDGSFSYTVDFANVSSSWVDEFTVEDHLLAAEQGVAQLVSIITPQAWQDFDGLMNVWYRTSKTPDEHVEESMPNATLGDGHENPWLSDPSNNNALGDDGRVADYTGWRLWEAGVPTTEARTLEVSDLGLAEGEVVTALRFEYGCVEEGFTTRLNGWERDDLKHEHDDTDKAPTSHDGEIFNLDGREVAYTPAVIEMRVTDAYREGTALDNAVSVDAYRNGGGEGLEAHDRDFVTQRPKDVTPPRKPESPLSQTGDPSDLLGIAAIAGVSLIVGGYARTRRDARAER